tara:strand:- start:8472 stop:8981 length:510 start_codon:yes stop_codon:yes gene_type:complete
LSAQALNVKLLGESVCFGCGPANTQGLNIKVHYDPDNSENVIGHFTPDPKLIGFPGITHGGVIFTALDCMACWAGMLLTTGAKSLWLTRSAQVTYHRPARESEPVFLSAYIPELDESSRIQVVHSAAKNESGDLLVNGRYKMIALSPKKFMSVLGIEKLPEDWASWVDS